MMATKNKYDKKKRVLDFRLWNKIPYILFSFLICLTFVSEFRTRIIYVRIFPARNTPTKRNNVL